MQDPDKPPPRSDLRIALVGPCSSGKTILGDALKAMGYTIKQPTQEHSNVATMWQRITKPDLLIYLDIDYPNMRARRPHHDGGQRRLDDQHRRLAHARQHCHFYIDTSGLTPGEVKTAVLTFLNKTLSNSTP